MGSHICSLLAFFERLRSHIHLVSACPSIDYSIIKYSTLIYGVCLLLHRLVFHFSFCHLCLICASHVQVDRIVRASVMRRISRNRNKHIILWNFNSTQTKAFLFVSNRFSPLYSPDAIRSLERMSPGNTMTYCSNTSTGWSVCVCALRPKMNRQK